MSETSDSQERSGPSGLPSSSGDFVTLSRAELEGLIASSVQRALGEKKNPSSVPAASEGERLQVA